MSNVIFFVRKMPRGYVAREIDGSCGAINQEQVIKRTAKGYRLKMNYAPEKGAMYLDEHYHFFESYDAALEFVLAKAKIVAFDLEQEKQRVAKFINDVQKIQRDRSTKVAK